MISTDVNTVGAGPAGLVAIAEVTRAGRPVTLLDQASQQNLGRQAVSGRQPAHAISYVTTQGATR
ncbi:NAD(P)-binding protein [Streptomyces cinnabarinus]|uniref:NAD(P)-binding protein n=1 Tax=Streptomyces cinnabarinus TaxID=67287 RepID=A0ABY7KTU3_9ACTN|nr:NAD(P)-binding protein [Streptomyces cinnabarinus]WAZ26832.1 NAD(P)-binding protein [Streptomyces cinnabarinus]